jgi:hypothetical protein
MAGKASSDTLHCSFCGKDQHEVRKLLAGPKVCICDECVRLCMDIIEGELAATPDQGRLSAGEIDDAARQQREAEERENALRRTTPKLLESLQQEHHLMELMRSGLAGTIGVLRERGVSDGEIQRWLDITPEIAIDLYLGPASAGARAGSDRDGSPAKMSDPESDSRPGAESDQA